MCLLQTMGRSRSNHAGEGNCLITPRVTHDVEHYPIRILDKEAPDSPRLRGQGVDDLESAGDRLGVHPVDVGNLDGEVGMALRSAALQDADLGCRVAR